MMQNVDNSNNLRTSNVITISSQTQQGGTRVQNSQQSNRSDRKNRFNLPSDSGIYNQSLNQSSGGGSSRIQVQTNSNGKIIEKKASIKQNNNNLKPDISIKEDVVNEASSMCKSLSNKTIQLTNQKNNIDQTQQQSNKIKVVYGNQVLQVRQNQSKLADQMNSSMQSFYSKKSKDLQVYSAQDNKMLVLEVKNPENIEKLKHRIEQEEKRKKSGDFENKSQIVGDEKAKTKNKLVEQKDQKDSENILSCKICLEEGNSDKQGKIFTPCQCTGTCKWIHEECLKEWIISRYVHLQTSNNPRDFLKAECEICKYKYNMKFKTQYKFFKNNIFTRFGKKNFLTCLCSLLCVVAYICCLLFFLVINKSSDSDDDSTSNNSNNNNGNNSSKTSNSHDMSVQSYEYALIIVCTLLIMLSIIVCIISTRQAFFRRSISKWIIYKYDPIIKIIKGDQQIIEHHQDRGNPNIQRQSIDNSLNNQGNDRYYYNGQTFTSDLRNNTTQFNNRQNSLRQNYQNRNSLRRDYSTQDQSQNSHIFNLRNSELMGIRGSQNLMLIQDQTQSMNQNNNQNREGNDESKSVDISGQIDEQNRLDNTEIIRINNNFQLNEEDDPEYLNNSQDIAVYQFNNERQQPFNYAENY